MRVAVTSDTHGRQNWEMPPCDVFVHAGDITGRGSIEETSRFAARLRDEMSSPHGPRHAIIIPGNHDQCFGLFPTPVRELFGENVHVLVDEAVILEGVRFYGSPWTPPFMRWHFMADERRLASLYSDMPDALDMLVTHGPPRGILDPGWQEAHVGSTALVDAVAARKITHHVFGHLHAAGGQSIQSGTTTFHNVAACNDQYVLVNQPKVIEVQPSVGIGSTPACVPNSVD